MRPCPECRRAMRRETETGKVSFKCYCGVEVAGRPEDAQVAGGVLRGGKIEEMYRRLILNAPFDRTNQLVARDCPECGLDYMTQVRVGEREAVVWVCKCGFHASSQADEAGAGA